MERAELIADPASAIRFPGTDDLLHVGGEREDTFEGPRGSFEGHVFGSAATTAEIFAYYDDTLTRMGWRRETPGGKDTTQLEIRDWCKSRMTFSVATYDQAIAFQPGFYRGKEYTTVFGADIFGRSTPCPAPFKPQRTTTWERD